VEWKGPCGIDADSVKPGARVDRSGRNSGSVSREGQAQNRLNRAAGPAMKLAGPLAGGSPRLRLGLRLVLALETEGHRGADEILQSRLIDLVAFIAVDGV